MLIQLPSRKTPLPEGQFCFFVLWSETHYKASLAFLVSFKHQKHFNKLYSQSKLLDNFLSQFDQYLLQFWSGLLAREAEKSLEANTRFIAHEARSAPQVLNNLWAANIKSPQHFFNLSEKSKNDNADAFLGATEHIGFLLDLTYVLTNDAKIKMTKITPYKDLFYKWEKAFNLILNSQSKKIVTLEETIYSQDQRKPDIFGDKDLIFQAVYSLVSNAAKYSHAGTTIYIDLGKENLETSAYDTRLIDYGVKMEQGNEVCELYHRGEDLEQDGSGIGLFIVKKIMGIYKGAVNHRVKNKISDYNAGLIDTYLGRFPDKELAAALGEEKKRLNAERYYQHIVSNMPINPAFCSDLILENDIKIPTYEVEVILTFFEGEF